MKNELRMNYPASWWKSKWREALPSGNGRIGASVYGSIHEETVLLTHEDLWWKSRTPELPDVSGKLPEVRHLLMEGNAHKADRILSDSLKEQGYNPQIACPLPLGNLRVRMPVNNGFKNYSRRLNMETGEVSVEWLDGQTAYKRALFVSRSHDMVILEVSQKGPDRVEAAFRLGLHDFSNVRKPQFLEGYDLNERLEVSSEEGMIYYAAQNDDGKDFGAVARIIAEGGAMEYEGEGIKVTGSERVLVYIKLFVKGERKAAWNRLSEELLKINSDYATLLKAHSKEHARLFGSMQFDLFTDEEKSSNEELLMKAYRGEAPDEMMEKMWAYGRYLLVSSTRKDGLPCHLYGLWCGDYDGMWAFNMCNENLQMIYWQALQGNIPELMLPVFNYCEDKMEDFRHNAKKLFGCRGIYIPAPFAPDSGRLKHTSPHIIHWTGGAGWIASHYYDYYLYTGDVKFFKERALPFMREVALFYEDFFIVGEDGLFISCPSNSPENTPGNYLDKNGEGAVMETTINATMDFAIAKELLQNLIEGCEAANVAWDEIGKWKEMLKRIPPYQINEDGAVKEWMHPFFKDNYHHRHQSHIYPVFPGREVTKEKNPGFFNAFVTALKKRLTIGLREQTGWSLAHMANSYARMGEGELAVECLDLLSRSCVVSNFFTLHNDWRNMGISVESPWSPFQIDANMGWTSAIQEMLLFSLPGEVKILPALPQRWRKGKIGPMLARGGIEVTLDWNLDEGAVNVDLLSPKLERTVTVILPEKMHREDEFGSEGITTHKIDLEADKPYKLKYRARPKN